MVDFEKAFDTVEHQSLWRVLAEQGVPSDYIALLQLLYSKQSAVVQASARSRPFCILRGVKQGDPLSALLFIAVMGACFTELQKKWDSANKRRRKFEFGVKLDESGRNLTDVRFADDVILAAMSRSDIVKMLHDLSARALTYGLKINFAKTKVLTWNSLRGSCEAVFVFDQKVDVLDERTAERYLGRKLCFESSQQTELNNRIASGWAAFHKNKGELCSKFYRLQDRVRLFEATVTPAVLYGSSTWALTKQMEGQLRVARRRMLRYVFRIHRTKNITEADTMEE